MTDSVVDSNRTSGVNGSVDGGLKKRILINAFDMSTVGHLSPGQWKVSACIDFVSSTQ